MPTAIPKRGSLKAKGRATRSAILDAAQEVFKRMGYYGSSVSEITRRCGVSMGTFYKYFKNKEIVFQELNDAIIAGFMQQAQSLEMHGLCFEDRLARVIALLYHHTREHLPFNIILGESELIDRVTIAHYDAIAHFYRQFFRAEAQAGNIRPLDPNILAYALIGSCYFHSFDWKSTPVDYTPAHVVDLMCEFALHGVSGPAPWARGPGWSLLAQPEPVAMDNENKMPLTKGDKTRQAIFSAAEKVIGECGINRANISEITRVAGVAQGTFYVHFASKIELIEGFVKFYNHRMRCELQRAVASVQDRRDAERVGVLSFFEFTRQHRGIYRIVPECEIISRDVSIWYYNKIIEGYVKGLKRAMEKEEIRPLPPIFLARSLMGLTHFIALKWIIWATASQSDLSNQMRSDIVEFLLFGLSPATQ